MAVRPLERAPAPRDVVAYCACCGWTQTYSTPKTRSLGADRHRNRTGCPRNAQPRVTEALARLAALDLPPERTVAEWCAHPTALVELLLIVDARLTQSQLGQYRRHEGEALRARLAELTVPEQRRIARADAIRDRLVELAAAAPSPRDPLTAATGPILTR